MITFPFSAPIVTHCRVCGVGDDDRRGVWQIWRVTVPGIGIDQWDLCPDCARLPDPGASAARAAAGASERARFLARMGDRRA